MSDMDKNLLLTTEDEAVIKQKINKLSSLRGFLKDVSYKDLEDAKWEALSKKCGL